jgi:aspartyl/asparaginyl beta-hydroxylase (cupin superfamily)
MKHKNYDKFFCHLSDLLECIKSDLGHVSVRQAILTRLCSGDEIKRHKDVGPITKQTHRIHVPIVTNEDCIFTIAEESRNLKAGEIWIIDNTDRYHSVANNGNLDRVHLIVDVI